MSYKNDQIINWSETGSIPDSSGIYAWYYRPEITEYDLNEVIAKITKLRTVGNLKEACDVLSEFIENNVLKYFSEEPFIAKIEGPLKPQYTGMLKHKSKVSNQVLERIVNEPDRLTTMKKVLETSAPDFSSPLYIGMSEHLGKRIRDHQKDIIRYREEKSITESNKIRDHSFAKQVSTRNFAPERLFVVIKIIDDEDKRYIDLENILNRIHYPLLGRN